MLFIEVTVCWSLRYDIALLRLTSDATLNNYVQLAALPPANQVLPNKNPCYISGWGRTQSESDIRISCIYTIQEIIRCSASIHGKAICKNHKVKRGFFHPDFFQDTVVLWVFFLYCCTQLEVRSLPSWSRPLCLLLTTIPAPAADGGGAQWRPPWFVLVAAAILAVRWAKSIMKYFRPEWLFHAFYLATLCCLKCNIQEC